LRTKAKHRELAVHMLLWMTPENSTASIERDFCVSTRPFRRRTRSAKHVQADLKIGLSMKMIVVKMVNDTIKMTTFGRH